MREYILLVLLVMFAAVGYKGTCLTIQDGEPVPETRWITKKAYNDRV